MARDAAARRPPRRTRRVVLAVFPDFQLLDLSGPHEVFAAANDALDGRGSASPRYGLEVAAGAAGPVASQSGLAVLARRSFRQTRGSLDTLIAVGGQGTRSAVRDRALLGFLRRTAPRARRICAVCTGTFLLAEAGLLTGRRVTTHWGSCARLARHYPTLRVESDPIYVRDGDVWTSAGVTAGMDLALALVEADHGRDVALEVARRLVLFLKRPGGQSQFSAQLERQWADREPVRDVQSYVTEHPGADLRIAALAARAAMSPRNFARVFREQVGVTPARFVDGARVEAARQKLEETTRGVDEIAASCGFGSAETMRRAFQRQLGVGPADYRKRFQVARLETRREETG